MGEFLLSLLKFGNIDINTPNTDADNRYLVYAKTYPHAKFKINDRVPTYNPHPDRYTDTRYYRMGDKSYSIALLHELLDTQDYNLIDKDINTTLYHRQLRDETIYNLLAGGRSLQQVSTQYKWHREAVRLAVSRHRIRLENMTPKPLPDHYILADDGTPIDMDMDIDIDIELPNAITPITRSSDEQARYDQILKDWG
jgi:hypothetical protein